MGFFGKRKLKEDIEEMEIELSELREECLHYRKMLTPEMQDAIALQKKIEQLQNQEVNLINSIKKLNTDIASKREEAIFFEDAINFQEFGLYTPRYEFVTAEEYKTALNDLRATQKQMIKDDRAILGNKNWTVDGSKRKGQKMVKDMKKLFLRAFNSDCEDAISRVKYSNFDMSLKKIFKSAEAIEKLGTLMSLLITNEYINAKVDELHLAFEYQQKKQEEKEAAKAARAEMREAAKLQKEIEAQRKKIEKEHTHYQTALKTVEAQLQSNPDDINLKNKYDEIISQLNDIDKSLKDIDYREANQKAGYVYIISNVGAFGEDIYKIGMTRRLDPQERVDELGDASVPFNFDVHAMIFSDNAPALENALHNAFADRKVNMVNQRREFFNVTLDEIKHVVKMNFDKTIEFIDVPEAEQYRITQKLKSK